MTTTEFLAFVAGVASGASVNHDLAALILRRIVEDAEIVIKHKRGKPMQTVKLQAVLDLSDLTTAKRD